METTWCSREISKMPAFWRREREAAPGNFSPIAVIAKQHYFTMLLLINNTAYSGARVFALAQILKLPTPDVIAKNLDWIRHCCIKGLVLLGCKHYLHVPFPVKAIDSPPAISNF